jgi:hypothetical protein
MKANSSVSKYLTPGIMVLSAAAGLIHLLLNVFIGQFDLMFTLNGLGYLALLTALFFDVPYARDHRKLVRLGMIGYSTVTIIAWIILGDKAWWLGWLTIVIELALIGLLTQKRP